jgi:hypothetical protein
MLLTSTHPSSQISFHFLQCIFQHCHITKGAPPAAGAMVGGAHPPAGHLLKQASQRCQPPLLQTSCHTHAPLSSGS